MTRFPFVLAALGFALILSSGARAASDADYRAAYAAAEAANREAGALKNQWTTTTETLKEAQQVASSGNYDEAMRLARRAEALAKASVAQAKEEDEAWKAAVVH